MVVCEVPNQRGEQVRMQVEGSSGHVGITLMSLDSSGERGMGTRGAPISEPVDAMRG